MKPSDIEQSMTICILLHALLRDEGSDITFHNLNPDFNMGEDICVSYAHSFGDVKVYKGDTILECLRNIAADMEITITKAVLYPSQPRDSFAKVKQAAIISYISGVGVGIGLGLFLFRFLVRP